MGFEPFTYQYPWTSEDIWVRNQNDGIEEHQNPEYYTQSGSYNYVYIRVRNKGCQASQGNEKVKLYWAKAATALSWPNHWNGSLSVSGNSLGDFIGEVTLPIIQPGDAYIATFPWTPPNPANFVGLVSDPLFWADQPHHFCLLSRIVGTSDPMTTAEGSNIATNVLNNNNIAWKNLSVVDLDPNNITGGFTSGTDKLIGATVLIGDAWNNGGVYDIEFKNPDFLKGEPITENAEIKITLDSPIWDKWVSGGYQGENIEVYSEEQKQLIIIDNYGKIKNLSFSPNERGLLHTSFNFLTEELSEQAEFYFEINQLKNSDNSIVGGELYKIAVPNRSSFLADAGNDKEVDIGDYVSLNALQISENAIYNWYNEEGNLIYTGKDFSLSPEVTQKYKLEVIATIDGFKDYDEVEIKVNKNKIILVSPNPATSNLNIEYDIDESVNSAYLVLVKHMGNVSNQYVLNVSNNTKQIDVSIFQNGTYSLVLICDGAVSDYKNLIIQ